MVKLKVDVQIVSGVEDGAVRECSTVRGDGQLTQNKWTLTIGRRDDNDICLPNDTFVSRKHAHLHWRGHDWWLEDCNSTNGTFVINETDFFEDQPVKGFIHLIDSQLFRVGRTWLRIQVTE